MRNALPKILLLSMIFMGCGDGLKQLKNESNERSAVTPSAIQLNQLNELDETNFNNCSANWVTQLSTDNLTPKIYSGDTNAAYALFAFEASRRNRYVFRFKGKTPNARFFSFETYEGPLQGIGNHIFDHELIGTVPAAPALSRRDHKYQFTVHPPEDSESLAANLPGYSKLELTKSKIKPSIKTVMLRIYSPDDLRGITNTDMPEVFAFDPDTGRPKACPQTHHFKPVDIPQQAITLMRGLKTSRSLEFASTPSWFSFLGLGANAGIDDYVSNTTRIDAKEDVAVIKFRVPFSAYDEQSSQVRYWSFCFQNFAKNTTLACLPDYVAKSDQGKIITLVYGRPNQQLEQASKAAGYYFIPDLREENLSPSDLQRVVGFVYRNLLTTPGFASTAYTGDYKPSGKLCTRDEFLHAQSRTAVCQ